MTHLPNPSIPEILPGYDSPNNPQNFFLRFFKQDILLILASSLYFTHAPRTKIRGLHLPQSCYTYLP